MALATSPTSSAVLGAGSEVAHYIAKWDGARWGSAYWKAVHTYNMGGGYVNFMFDDEADGRLQAAYGDNYARLAQAKMKYDPKNLFRVNQNIAPAAAV